MGMIIYQTPNCPHPPDLSAEMQWHLLWLLRNKIKAVYSRETTVYGAKLVKTTLEDTCYLRKLPFGKKKRLLPSANPNPKVVWKEKNMANSHSPYDVMAKIDGFSEKNRPLTGFSLLPRWASPWLCTSDRRSECPRSWDGYEAIGKKDTPKAGFKAIVMIITLLGMIITPYNIRISHINPYIYILW